MVGNETSRRPARRQAAALAVIVVAVAAVATTAILQGSPSAPASSVSPTSSPVGSGGAPLDLEPFEAVATLRPSAEDDAGIAPDATFTLASLTDEPARALADRLELSPPVDFAVSPGSDATTATITPKVALTAGATYRATLRGREGAVAASWALRVRGPVTVTSTIPGDATVAVPVNTGIEVTFDQEGVAAMADHFSIEPAVEGRFERHGRTQVFVPTSLAAETTYTVTIRKGLARTGTDLELPADVVFRFETEGSGVQVPRVVVGRDVIETGPAERPVIATRFIAPESEEAPAPAPASADVRVYRLPGLDAAHEVLADFLRAPRWTDYSDPLMPTAGLPVVATFTAALEPVSEGLLLLRFPDTLERGWYVVEIQGERPSQAFLQVTPVSAWVSVLSDQTVAWVNDVQSHEAIAGAAVSVGSGAPFARSDADGLAIGPTPASLVPPAIAGESGGQPSPILRVTARNGDVVLVPFDVRGLGEAYRGEWSEKWEPADDTFWAMLYTDRGVYRRTDRIDVWGYLRSRDDGTVPAKVTLRLVGGPDGRDRGTDAALPAVVETEATPGPDGAFTANLDIVNLPLDSYRLQAVVNGHVVVSRSLSVSIIRKPPYQVELTSDRHAVVDGTKVTWTATASFFDGTPVASVDLLLSGPAGDDLPKTTDAAGLAAWTTTARASRDDDDEIREDADSWYTNARPAGPESAEIWANDSILVFPSALDLQASGIVTDGRLRVTGTLSKVDLAKVEAQLAAGSWDGDAAGDPVRGQAVRVRITELIPVRHQVGSEYDFIDKVVRPVYEYETERKALRTASIESGAGGKLSLTVDVPDATHEYEVVLSTRDSADRLAQRTVLAGRPVERWWEDVGILFETAGGRPVDEQSYGLGEKLAWRMVDRGENLPSGGTDRYLYLVAQRGLRSAAISDEPTFRRTYGAADAPGIFVIGVWFSGTTYAPKAAAWADFDAAERQIQVRLASDRERYRPGETATISVETTGPDGRPVPSTVVLQAVDEKLYAMGDATVPDPLQDLYRRVDSGIVRLTATHQVPTNAGPEGEGGDTTGGGARSDFKDTLLFRELQTDASGKGVVSVKLSDDLTSWHFTASAVTSELAAGVGERLVPVGLPFFVELTVADGYLATDHPSVQLRAFGDALRDGDAVSFTIASSGLGMAETRIAGTAFAPTTVALPALALGRQSITVTATVSARKDAAGRPLNDGLTQSFDVVGSRLTAGATAYGDLADGLPAVPAGAERSTWTFADAGRGRLVSILTTLAAPSGMRLDRALAQSLARDLLVSAFGRDEAGLPASTFDRSAYPFGTVERDDGSPGGAGLALLPYSSVDPWLAARVAVLSPATFDQREMVETLEAIRGLATTKRDLAIAVTSGLAALGEPVLDDLRAARLEADLTPAEMIDLALGFEAVGDDAAAREIERDLLARYGERVGSWVRLRLDRTPGGSDPTALLAVVAAGLGDPLADGLVAYAMDEPVPDTTNGLELVAYVARSLVRTPAAAASFAYTVDGTRTVVRLGVDESFTVVLSPAQAAGLRVENLAGRVGVAIDARVPVAVSSLRPHADLSLTRLPPADPIPTVGLVTVDLTATFGERAPDGCYEVVELVPSGLAPVEISWEDGGDEGAVTWPASVVGQEVRFCAFNEPSTGHSARLRYLARVVSEGTFTWEPAVMQLPGATELLAVAPAGTARVGAR